MFVGLQVNEHLASRTYLVGNSPTLADMVVFAVTHSAAVSATSSAPLTNPHLPACILHPRAAQQWCCAQLLAPPCGSSVIIPCSYSLDLSSPIYLQASFPAAQTLHFCNLLRWADLLQHTLDTKGFFPKFSLDKPRYVYTPPAPVVKVSSNGQFHGVHTAHVRYQFVYTPPMPST